MASARKLRPCPRVYLDACALQRPFDRLTSAEERAEAAGERLIRSWTLSSRVELTWSTVPDHETLAPGHLELLAW